MTTYKMQCGEFEQDIAVEQRTDGLYWMFALEVQVNGATLIVTDLDWNGPYATFEDVRAAVKEYGSECAA